MTTEERALEISESFYRPETGYDNEELYMSAMAMSEWQEQQMIDKACEWLKKNLQNYIEDDWTSEKDFIEEFRKAMEE